MLRDDFAFAMFADCSRLNLNDGLLLGQSRVLWDAGACTMFASHSVGDQH
jgi:hypothetical protein